MPEQQRPSRQQSSLAARTAAIFFLVSEDVGIGGVAAENTTDHSTEIKTNKSMTLGKMARFPILKSCGDGLVLRCWRCLQQLQIEPFFCFVYAAKAEVKILRH
jgi:hypothetical protein